MVEAAPFDPRSSIRVSHPDGFVQMGGPTREFTTRYDAIAFYQAGDPRISVEIIPPMEAGEVPFANAIQSAPDKRVQSTEPNSGSRRKGGDYAIFLNTVTGEVTIEPLREEPKQIFLDGTQLETLTLERC